MDREYELIYESMVSRVPAPSPEAINAGIGKFVIPPVMPDTSASRLSPPVIPDTSATRVQAPDPDKVMAGFGRTVFPPGRRSGYSVEESSMAMVTPPVEKTRFVAADDELVRGDVAGYNVQTRGPVQRLYPRISRRHFEALQDSRLPSIEPHLEDLLARMSRLSATARSKFVSTRKAVWKPMAGGTSRLVVVPDVPSSVDEVDLVEGLPVEEALAGLNIRSVTRSELESRQVSRTYQLAQVLNDVSVMDKYPVTMRQLKTARRVIASDPQAAARLLQEAMNSCQDTVRVTVTAAAYDRSRSQAALTLREFCSGYEAPSVAIASEVIGSDLYMYGGEGDDEWLVRGPIRHASEVYSMYCLVAAEGRLLPSVLLSMECVLLRIDIGTQWDMSEPTIEYHSGFNIHVDMPTGIDRETAAVVSVDARLRLERLSASLLPVVSRDGKPLATAVRVSDAHILVNTHVADADPGCTVGGEVLRPLVQLSRDVWAAKCDGECEPWKLREAAKDELVVLCCAGSSGLYCSAPLRVKSVDATCLVLSLNPDVTFGMSGAAVVALSDLALLGIHSAGTTAGLLAYKFGPAQFSELLSRDAVTSVSRASDVESFGGRVYEYFRKKGLGHLFKQTCNSMLELRNGLDHVGMGVVVNGALYTTVDPELAVTVAGSDVPLSWRSSSVGVCVATSSDVVGKPSPVYVRAPEVFEKVFVIGWDGQPYVSTETRVNYVGLNAASFVVADVPPLKPFVGGLVMAWDGAVLGLVGHRSLSTPVGAGLRCWPLPKFEVQDVASPRDVLTVSFPFLNTVAWPDSLLEEVFTHASVGRYEDGRLFNAGQRPLANVGDNAAKAALYSSLRDASVQHSVWAQYMQSLQSNEAFAKLAWKFKYAVCMRTAAGAHFPESSKAYADTTEALLGAAYEMETREVFLQLCKAMGIVYSSADFSNSFPFG